jgi:hypothetical protein
VRTHIRRKSAERRHSFRSTGQDLQLTPELPPETWRFAIPTALAIALQSHGASVKTEVSQVNAIARMRTGTSLVPSRQRVAVATYRLVRDQVWTMMALVRLLRVQRRSTTGVLEEEKW